MKRFSAKQPYPSSHPQGGVTYLTNSVDLPLVVRMLGYPHIERWWSAESFARSLCPNNSRLRSFYQKIPLKLGHSCDDLHCHLSCRTG